MSESLIKNAHSAAGGIQTDYLLTEATNSWNFRDGVTFLTFPLIELSLELHEVCGKGDEFDFQRMRAQNQCS